MEYPQAYIDYLVHFHATRDYFECHELLEDYWKKRPQNDPLNDSWVGLIQLAVAQYHHRRDNLAGTLKMLRQAAGRLREEPLTNELGLDGSQLLVDLRTRLDELEAAFEEEREREAPFTDYELPFADPALKTACLARSEALGAEWGAASRLDDGNLVHRHTKRDRSEVVRARQASLAARKRTRS